MQHTLLGLVIVGLWAGFYWKMTVDWSSNAHYQFGFFVPFFVGYLVVRRWADRPERSSHGNRALLVAAAVLLLLVFPPLRVVVEANPDWRPLNWIYAAVVVGLTLAAAGLLGGRKWAAHFALPLCLIFFAIPWPIEIEQGTIQMLTRAVTGGTTELLNLFGIAAVQRGNIIETPQGFVGVNDACSGIRSLAGTLMSGAFFGELFRLTWVRRVGLVIAGVSLALLLNLVRACFLAVMTAEGGASSMARWHDPAGFSIFAVAFGLLWLLADRLETEPTSGVPRDETVPNAGLSPLFLCVAVAWLIAVEVGTEVWYQLRERTYQTVASWIVRWPSGTAGVESMPIPDEVKAVWRYTDAESATYSEPGKPEWSLFFAEWEPGRTSAQLAVMHRPDICLPSQGMQALGVRDVLPVRASGLTLPFESWVFEDTCRRVYVFRTLWEERNGGAVGTANSYDLGLMGRLRSAWHGRRNSGQKMLLISVTGARGEEEAREDLKERLPPLILVTGNRARFQ